MDIIKSQLLQLQDLKYKDFHKKLIPTVNEETIIGIRTSELRKLAKELYNNKEKSVEVFLEDLPHKFYEENNLHAFIIENIKDYEESILLTEKFLPYIDNWATCDSFSPKIFKKYPEQVYEKIKIWINSDKEYTVRYAIGVLLSNYLDNEFKEEMLELVSNIRSEKYYINMMIAWYFATALAKQYEKTVKYLENKNLDPWVHNKSIQKAVESRRISESKKMYLKTLKIRVINSK